MQSFCELYLSMWRALTLDIFHSCRLIPRVRIGRGRHARLARTWSMPKRGVLFSREVLLSMFLEYSPKIRSLYVMAAIVDRFLEKRYNDDIELEDAIHTAILTLKEGFEGQISESNSEIALVNNDKQFRVRRPSHFVS